MQHSRYVFEPKGEWGWERCEGKATASANDAAKDTVNVVSSAEGNVGHCSTPISSTAAPNDGNILINVTDSPTIDPTNYGPIFSGPTSYAKLVTSEPSKKSVNFRTLIAPAVNEADVAILLESWNPDVNLLKEDVGNVLVLVKFHGVPMTAFSKDDLSVIATKLDTHLMLDSYTSDMCIQSWGRSSYARAMIELRADVELKDTIVVVMPKLVGEGFYMCTTCVENEWKPPRCLSCKVFGNHMDECPKKIISDVVKNLQKPRQAVRCVQVGPKQAEVSKQEVSNSNLFDVLNSLENDDDLRINEGNSKSSGKGGGGGNYGVFSANHGSFHLATISISTTLIAEMIDKLERQILDGKLILVDDDGKPLPKVVSTVNTDGDSEVEDVCKEIQVLWHHQV
ncbi:hypothetical protein Tco_1406484 [Tanacetum coccineum]